MAVVSNQGGISLRNDSKSLKSDLKRLSDFKGKFTSVAVQLDFPISIYAATSKDQYRKPRVGMWAELRKDNHLGSLDSVDLENSFFVGDAGGRPRDQAANTVKDHSCVDRLVTTSRVNAVETDEDAVAETLRPTSGCSSRRPKSTS